MNNPAMNRPISTGLNYFLLGLLAAVSLFAFPAFYDHYTLAKWSLLYLATPVLAIILIVFLARKKNGQALLPNIGKWMFATLVALFAYLLIHNFSLNPKDFGENFLIMLTMGSLVCGFYIAYSQDTTFIEKLAMALGVLSFIVSIVGILQYLSIDLLLSIPGAGGASSFFGNVNMTAEFLGLALIFHLFMLIKSPPASQSAKWLINLYIYTELAYIILLACRSVYIALSLVFVWLVLTKALKIRRVFVILAIGLSLSFCFNLIKNHVPDSIKTNSSHTARLSHPIGKINQTFKGNPRLDIWQESIKLIAAHPILGVGMGNFAFTVTPYRSSHINENAIYEHPHNELLKFFAEIGIPATMVLLIIIGSFIFRWYQHCQDNIKRRLIIAFVIFFGIQAFFQFPFSNPLPFMVFACLLAWMLQDFPKTTVQMSFSPKLITASILTSVFLFSGTESYRHAISQYIYGKHYQSPFFSKLACQINQSNWRACLTAAWHRSQQGQPELAQPILESLLTSTPQHYKALQLYGNVLAQKGEIVEACLAWREYNRIFHSQGNESSAIANRCRLIPPVLLSENHFLRRYQKRERSILRPNLH